MANAHDDRTRHPFSGRDRSFVESRFHRIKDSVLRNLRMRDHRIIIIIISPGGGGRGSIYSNLRTWLCVWDGLTRGNETGERELTAERLTPGSFCIKFISGSSNLSDASVYESWAYLYNNEVKLFNFQGLSVSTTLTTTDSSRGMRCTISSTRYIRWWWVGLCECIYVQLYIY